MLVKISSYLFCVVICLSSCNPSNKEHNTIENKSANLVVHHLKNEETFDAQLIEIDSFILAYGKVASSLDYSKEDGTFEHADAHLNEEGDFLRVDEQFRESNDGIAGLRSFYVLDKKVFASRELVSANGSSASGELIERISYYAPNGTCLKTKERKGSSEDVMKRIPFNAVPKLVCNFDRVLDMLNQKNEFRLTFQGFINAKDGKYLVVGEPGENTFTSALKIEKPDAFIREVEKDQLKFINGTIFVNFDKVREMNGYTFQRYLSASWSKPNV